MAGEKTISLTSTNIFASNFIPLYSCIFLVCSCLSDEINFFLNQIFCEPCRTSVCIQTILVLSITKSLSQKCNHQIYHREVYAQKKEMKQFDRSYLFKNLLFSMLQIAQLFQISTHISSLFIIILLIRDRNVAGNIELISIFYVDRGHTMYAVDNFFINK